MPPEDAQHSDRHTEKPSAVKPEDELSGRIEEQDEEARQFALDFLKKVIRLRGVRIDRDAFLRQELRKVGCNDELIERAIASGPFTAGVSLEQLDLLATHVIQFETRKSAAMSFAAGLPGGFGLAVAIPGDIVQYYVHAFRVMQKLAYLFGWHEFIRELDDVDDETVGQLTLFLGVMLGVGGAATSLTTFARQVAQPALQKQLAAQALTKTSWYPVVKKVLHVIGVNVTKGSLSRTVTKIVPVVGGVIGGSMTLITLQAQSSRLHQTLRELPPPGVDAEAHAAALANAKEPPKPEADAAREAVGNIVGGAASTVADAGRGLVGSAGAAGRGAQRALGSLFKKRKGDSEGAEEDASDDPIE